MEQAEAIRLIKNGVTSESVQSWADLGCGSGTFTSALAALLPATGHITAVDKQRQHFPEKINDVSIQFIHSDFINDTLVLANVDGILMANSFHYVKDKLGLFKKLNPCFRYKPMFIIVEYESRRANAWVPYPITYSQLASLAAPLGYDVQKIGEMSSRFGGLMYSALLVGYSYCK